MTDTAIRSFADLGVDAPIIDALAGLGITTPFPIQELTLPLALHGADMIGQARTGTGKTLAFGIPLLQRVQPGTGQVQALVIVPTRELCVQVYDDLRRTGAARGVRVVALYGGKALQAQSDALAEGTAEIVVGTPGRLLDLLRRRRLDLGQVTGLVLDEADEMLDLGFLPDVEQLITATPDERQTLLFSATMPSEVVKLARRYMRKPTFLRADVEESSIAPQTRQFFFSVHRMDKPAVLARLLESPGRGRCVVFTRTKRMADLLVVELRERGVNASALHSDLRQEARERTISRFRDGRVDVLVATEVAARGLDIVDVTHVVNYDCPDDEKMYLHRIGRTGRAGAAGMAVTLAIWNELARLELIRKALDIAEPVREVFSTSPELDELFDLPPRPQRSADRPGGGGRKPAARKPDVEQVEAAPALAEAEAPADGAAAAPARRRSRRGGRRRGRGGGAAPAVVEEQPAGAQTSPPEVVQPEPAPVTKDETKPLERDSRRTRVRKRVTQDEEPPGDGKAAAAAPAARAAAAQAPAPAASNGRRPARRSSGGRRDRREPARGRDVPRRTPAPAADAGTLRGPGRPALQRSMRITHLP